MKDLLKAALLCCISSCAMFNWWGLGPNTEVLKRWGPNMPKSNIQCSPCTPGLDEAAVAAKASLESIAPEYAKALDRWWYWMTIEPQATPSWVDGWGRKIAGFDDGLQVIVGSDYAALAHEFCHVAEYVKEGSTSMDHVDWDKKGFWRVIDDYGQRLLAPKIPPTETGRR